MAVFQGEGRAMKAVVFVAALAFATPAFAQSTGQSGGANSSFLTRELNRAPPSAIPPAPGTVTSRPLSQPAPTVAPVAPSTASTVVAPAPVVVPTPTVARPTAAPISATAPVPASAPVAAPPPVPAATEPPPPPPTVLDAAAIAALPFRVDLPTGVRITTGRPGPNFNIWSIRKGDQTLAMVYAGPASQFPIYDGQMVQAGGRSSIVVTEDNRRLALEHLFQRTTVPAEIHVWVASVEGTDRVLAEQIAQTVDPK